MTDKTETRTPPGGFEELFKMDQHAAGSTDRLATVEVLDTAEYACRWLVDHGIAVEAGPLVQLTALILQRADQKRVEQELDDD